MSQQDHDLMESVSADNQATAVTSPTSPPRRDSMEDADSSLTRKRPRLDNGPLDNRAMSADPAPAPAENTTTSHPQEMTIRSQPPSSSQPTDEASEPNGAASIMPAAEEESTPPVESVEELDVDVAADSPPVIAIDDDDAEAIDDIDLDYIHIEQDEEYHFRRFPFTVQLYQGNYAQAARQIAQHVSGGMYQTCR